MKMWQCNKSSSFSPSFLLLLIVVSLILVSLLVCTVVISETSSNFSSSALWTWRASSSSSLNKEKPSNFDEKSFVDSSSSNGSSLPILLAKQSTSQPLLKLDDEKLETSGPYSEKESEEVSAPKRVINRYSKLERLEAGLARARASIREAAEIKNLTSRHEDQDYVPLGPIYRNAYVFHRSYIEMEKQFKIYIYKEGEQPMFHDGPCKSIYSTEGRFIHQMEKENRFKTSYPEEAHVYFLPFSVVNMVQYLYVPGSHEIDSIGRTVIDYVSVITRKYPYWNRSLGADHFMLSCHDWGPRTSAFVPQLFNNSIRVLCNANISEGFDPSKDASFPEIHLRTGEIQGLIGGPSPSRRSILAFFAGRLHGHIRLLLLEQWKGKDEDVQVHDHLPDGVSYDTMLKNSRYCLCPSGYEVASPRIVEAIYSECVPVLISDHYVPPFSDVLNWNSFSVQLPVSEIPNIKRILMSISQNQYLRMHRRLKQVQRHFVVNGVPKRFDVFHMIVHSIWLRRLNIHIHN